MDFEIVIRLAKILARLEDCICIFDGEDSRIVESSINEIQNLINERIEGMQLEIKAMHEVMEKQRIQLKRFYDEQKN